MRWMLAAGIGILMLLPGAVAAQTPVASPVATPAAVTCGDWQDYRVALIDVWTTLPADAYEAVSRLFGVPFSDYAMVPPPFLRDAAESLDGYAMALAGVDDVPAELQMLHDAYLGRVVLLSHYSRANADGDVWGIAFYGDRITANRDEIETEAQALNVSCPTEWGDLTVRRPDPFPMTWTGWASPDSRS